MANNNNGMIMHKLSVKAKRLESGLMKIVNATNDGDIDKNSYAIAYALGCLGGDYVKKNLMKTSHFKNVIEELKENKFVAEDRADTLIKEWEASYKEQKACEEITEDVTKSEATQNINESVDTEEKHEINENLDVSENVIKTDNGNTEDDSKEITSVTFRYNNSTRATDPTLMPKEYRLIHDEALSSWMVYHTFPEEVNAYGKTWKKQQPKKVDEQVYDVTYEIEQSNMGF